jgi:hypothetical protein
MIWMLLCLTTLAQTTAGQSKKALAKYEEELAKARQLETQLFYDEALAIYRKLEEDHGDDDALKLSMANAYFRVHNLEEAMNRYTQVLGQTEQSQQEPVTPIHFYNYAELLLMGDQPAQALAWYKLYQQRSPGDSRAGRKIEGIEKRASFETPAKPVEISKLPINSDYPDFSPAFYGDELVFVSGRREGADGETAANYFDLYHSSLSQGGSFSKPEKFSDVINTGFHEGPVVFYNHNNRMIFTRNNSDGRKKSLEEKVVVRLQLLSSEKDTTTGNWKKPMLLSINNAGYSVGHPAITADGKRLYFSSDMPGGYGGTDLYVSTWSGVVWGKPENLGSKVNTEGNEMFPFLHHNEMLYFASDGHPGLGGLDIYEYRLGGESVRNMNKPVNSNRDDLGLILDEAGTKGYFSSNRGKGYSADDNVYSFSITKPALPAVEETAPVPAVAEPVTITVVIDEDPPVEIFYTVQLLALRNGKPAPRSFFGSLEGVMVYDGKDGFRRYAYGKYDTLEEAQVVLKTLQDKGFFDAFVRREEQYVELSRLPGVSVEEWKKQRQ